MKRRILACFLALSLELTLLPAPAMAVDGPVAEVNGVPYEEAQFQAAIEAAKDGGTVKLLRDYTLAMGSSRLDLTGFKGTFDLGTHTLTLDTTNQIAVYASGAELTVKNGTLAGSSDSHLIYSTNGGSLDMEDVTVTYTASGTEPMTVHTSVASTFKDVTITANAGGVEVGSGTGTFDGCTFKTTGGTSHPYTAVAVAYGGRATVVSGEYSAPYGLYVYSTGGTIDVQGGTFTGTQAAMRADAQAGYTSVITASNGTFDGAIEKGGGGTVNIELSGGSYTADPTDYLADGYLMKQENGSYQVSVDTSKIIELLPVGQTSGTKYASLAEALAAAEDYSTLKLLADVPVSGEVTISGYITVDLNGRALTGDGTLTVPSTDGNGLVVSGTGTVGCKITNQGNKYALRLDGGSYTGTVTGPANADVPGAKFSATTYSADNLPLTLAGYAPVLKGGWYEFEAIAYTINLVVNGGTLGEGFSTPISFTYGSSNTVTLPKVDGSTGQITRPGWTFGGWYYSDDNYTSSSNRAATASRGSISASTIAGKANADHVLDLYAKWTKVKEAAVLDASGSQLATYDTLQEALDAVEAGQTVKLLADVALADDTPAKLVDKGTADSPVTLNLNGKTISGSNSKTSATDSTPGGILWLNGSYATLTDTSTGEKGGVVNTFADKKDTFGLVVKATADHGGAVTVSGGVKIETNSTSQNTKAVYVQNNANQAEALTLDIQDAEVTSSGPALYATTAKGYSCTVTVSGGEFTSTRKKNAESSILPNGSPTVTVQGGTFHNWGTSDWGKVADGRVICIEQEAEDGPFTVTVAEQAPEEYVAYVDATDVYRAICLTKGGNLYTVHNIQTPAGRTIHVKKDVSYTFPEKVYYGDKSSGDPGSYLLTLDLAAGVTLSGGMALYSADVTVTGAGSLAADFTWTPADGFAMTANGESNGLYSCRMGSSAAKAVLTKKDGGEIYYSNVVSAITAARQNPGSTVKMLADYKNSLQVQLNKFNGVTADFTLDLNGCTYTYSGAYDAITLNDGAKLTLTDTSAAQNGALVTEGTRATIIANSAIAATGTGGTIVIEEGVTVKNMVLLYAPGSKLTVAGTIDTTGFKTYAVGGNGTMGDTEITIKKTAKITADPDTAAPAIYHPQSGTLTVEGGEITGYGGIQMCAGTLHISGSPTITASGAHAPGNAENDGYIPDGAAISIVDRSYPGGKPTVIVTGTPTVIAASGVSAVQAYTWNKTDKQQDEWPDAGTNVNISGGTYSTQPDAALLADGYAAKLVEDGNGNYIVKPENPAHQHAWAGEWTYDETAHWHECEAEDCDITKNSGKDGYAAHIKDSGTVTKAPTAGETGTKVYKCTECGYVMETVTLDKLDPDGKTYRIDTSVTGGTITPSAEVPEGGSLKVEYAPGTGYTAEGVSVKVDGVDVDAPSYYAFEAVTDDHSIVVVYREADAEPVVTTASIDLVGPNDSWPNTPNITLTDGAVTAVQAAGGIGGAFSVPENTTLPYWTYKGWTFTAEKDGVTETFGTAKTLTQALADWLTAKIGEGGWTLTMDSKTPGVYKPSSGGSGGGSSSSSTTKTETTKNSDGSTTTTVTDTRTGVVTETVKTAEGVTGTTVTDKDGDVTKITASIPADVARDAAASGEAVTLPVEAPAVKDADAAAAISVTVPRSAGAVKVEIPVEKVTSGTVAVIVNADGTEEIVKTSVTTAGGVALTLEGSATVKVIDNSKEFVDVHPVGHWATAYIDFVASREIFAGTTANTFTPEAPTTRGQLMTVLARLDGEEASGSGAIQKGMAWAVEKGVSDGTNPGGTITRQQLAAMLYRYAGSPATDYELTHPDTHKVSDYAVDAMRWAVANGIITGKADGTLDPHGLATRAQVAAMMARYCAKLG